MVQHTKSVNGTEHIRRLKDKTHMIISIDTEKASEIIEHPFMIKVLKELEREGTYLNIIKATYDKLIANILLNE
jgi:hypothetical protein